MRLSNRWLVNVCSEKGGTGKSTFALLLAAYGSTTGKRAIVLDIDLLGTELLSRATADTTVKVLPGCASLLGDPEAVRALRGWFPERTGGATAEDERFPTVSVGRDGRFWLWPSHTYNELEKHTSTAKDGVPRPEYWMLGYFADQHMYRLSELLACLLDPKRSDFDLVIVDHSPFRMGLSEAVRTLLEEAVFKKKLATERESDRAKSNVERLEKARDQRRMSESFFNLVLRSWPPMAHRWTKSQRGLDPPPRVKLTAAEVDVQAFDLATFFSRPIQPTAHGAFLDPSWNVAAGTFPERFRVLNRVPIPTGWVAIGGKASRGQIKKKAPDSIENEAEAARAAVPSDLASRVHWARRVQRQALLAGAGGALPMIARSVCFLADRDELRAVMELHDAGAKAEVEKLADAPGFSGKPDAEKLARLLEVLPESPPPISTTAIEQFRQFCEPLLAALKLLGP